MALEEPIFVDTNPVTILNDILSDFEEFTGKKIYPGQPEYAIASALAYHKSLAMSRVNEAGKAMLVDFAANSVLDYLAASFGITRIAAQGAVCTIGFNIVPGHLQVTIPIGTRIASIDGNAVFATDDDIVVPVGINYVEITATCQTTGTAANGYTAGNISLVQDPYAYISSAANTDTTSGGSEIESDEGLRERLKLATSIFSVAGSRNAYIYWTKTASSLITDVSVATYEDDHTVPPGEVDIYALLENGVIPTTAMNDKIASVLSAENIRPLTDTVSVKSPIAISYSLSVDIVKYKNSDDIELARDLYALLLDYGSSQRQKLGLDVVCSAIEKLCRIDGVYDVTVTIIPQSKPLTGRNLIVEPWEVADQTEAAITITGVNNG